MSKTKTKKTATDTPKLDLNTLETSGVATTWYVPTLVIPFELVNPETQVDVIPRQVADGIFRLKASDELHLDAGRTHMWHTGVKLNMPKYVDVTHFQGVPEGVTSDIFPRCVLHGHVHSIFDQLVNNGLEVVGPSVLTADMANGKELVVYLKNVCKQMCIIKAGDEIAELHFSIAPLSNLKLMSPVQG